MFKKIQGGENYKVDSNAGYTVDVWLPPLGYGFNTLTGEIERTDVIKRSNKPSEQYWERIELPKTYNELRKKEAERQKVNEDYYDVELEKIREKHWTYRLCGLWYYNNGVPTYITGEHYMYMNWWKLMDGYPEYRKCDRERYYFQEYCVWDERCAGILEGSNRRSGKSYRAGLFNYNYVSMTEDTRGGVQSKTDTDAKSFFRTKIVTPFKRLPHFFQPQIDLSAGSNMGKEIKFTTTAVRGKAAIDSFGDLGLNSFLDFRASGEYAYDGEPQQRNVQDEVGKPSDADPYDRWGVVKYCLRVGKKWIGKALLTTTPEELKGLEIEKTPFYKLWKESDYDDRDENGHTKTGLYRYFIPATHTLEVDKFGDPYIEKNKTYIYNTRAALKNNNRKLLSEIKKNCITVEEMFMATLDTECMFEESLLLEQLELLGYGDRAIVRGDFIWKDGKADNEVEFVESKNGSCWVVKEVLDYMKDKETVDRWGDESRPLRTMDFTMGVDPFDHDNTEDARNSKGAFVVYSKFSPFKKEEINNCPVVLYLNRPKLSDMFYEDFIKASVFFGADVLVENNRNGFKKYVINRGYEKHLIQLPGKSDYGVASSDDSKIFAVEFVKNFIIKNSRKLYFKEMVKQLLVFNIKKTEKYDAVMALLWAFVANDYRQYKKQREDTLVDIDDLIPSWLMG